MKQLTYMLIVISCFCWVPFLKGQETGAGGVNIELVAENIVGNVIYQDGITPVDNLPVRIWSKDQQKMIFRTRTDKDGVFQLPRMNQGESYIYIGQIKIDMKTLTQGGNMLSQSHDLVVVLSRPFTVETTPRISDMTVGAVSMSSPAILSNKNDIKDNIADGNAGGGDNRPQPEPVPPLPDPPLPVPPEPTPPVPPPIVSP